MADLQRECGECGLIPDAPYKCDHASCPMGLANGCCDVCHEPLEDRCFCQDEYAREHDRYAER